MRHNFTLIEVGWLCSTLFSLLRVSPQINADYRSKTLLKLINGSDCKWPNNDGKELMNALKNEATISRKTIKNISNPKNYAEEYFSRSKKLDKSEYQDELRNLSVENNYLDDEENLKVIWAMTAIYSLIALVGIIGNILVIVVVKKVPSMITPTNCYLVSLALSDCLFLCAAWPVEFSYLHADQNDYVFGPILCKILTFLPYLGINASSMSIMAFTIERFIGICYPLRARYICTVKRAKLIILFIWCFCILYNSPWFYLATLKEIEGVVVFVADFSTFYILPMFLYIYLYGKIAYTLTKCEWIIGSGSATSRPNKNDSRQNKYSQNGTNSINSSNNLQNKPSNNKNNQNVESQNNHNIKFRRASTTTNSKLQVIKMLALVAFIFAVCWLPYRAMVMYNSFASAINWEVWDSDWLIYMSKTMIFFNCAINPVLYNLMSSKFRKAFRLLLRGQKKHINVYKRGSAYLHDQNRNTNGDEVTELTTRDIRRFSTLITSEKENECLNGKISALNIK